MAKSSFSPMLVFATFITCFGSSLLYGYNLSVLNLPGFNVKCFFDRTILKMDKDCFNNNNKNESDTVQKKSKIDADFLYGMVNAVFVVAGAIGAFCTGLVADNIGRRNGLMFNSLFSIVGGIITGPTVSSQTAALIYVGRFIIGINCGITIGLASMYLMEIAPRDVRGIIGACHQLAVTIGIVVGNILTLDSVLNKPDMWSIAQSLTAIPAFIGLCLLPLCPESPRFLFLKKKDEEGAKAAFQKVNKVEDADHFIEEMRAEMNHEGNQETFRFLDLFTKKELRLAIAIACLIQVMQQLSGVNAVVGYSATLLETAGIEANKAQYCVVGIGAWNVLLTIISLPLLEKAGRRTLLLWPSAVLAADLILLTITVNLYYTSDAKMALSIVSVVACYIFMAAFALGLGPIPGLIVAEVTRQETRAAAYAVSQALQWICNLIVMASYPSLNKAISGYVFLLYFMALVICWVFFFIYMPETRNRTFNDITRDLALFKRQIGQGKTKKFIAEDLGEASNSNKVSQQPEAVPLVERKADDEAIA